MILDGPAGEGGGSLRVSIEPAETLAGFELLERGAILERQATVLPEGTG